MMISCRRATQLLSQSQDRRLSFVERLALRAHLLICDSCRTVDKQFDLLRRALRQLFDRKSG